MPKASLVDIFNSTINLSILLITRIGFKDSILACLKTAIVWVQTPSTASTKIKAPSHNLVAVMTWLEIDVSRRINQIYQISFMLMVRRFKSIRRHFGIVNEEMADDSIVIPRSCSSGRLSKNISIFRLVYEITPFDAKSESVNEVFTKNTQENIHIIYT